MIHCSGEIINQSRFVFDIQVTIIWQLVSKWTEKQTIFFHCFKILTVNPHQVHFTTGLSACRFFGQNSADDIAKIATLLNNTGGAANGIQILHPDLLAATLQQDTDDRGVDINAKSKYNNAFWATKYTERDGFDCEFWVPQMLGISGIVVVMMPNGSTYYEISDDGRTLDWADAVAESSRIISHCQ